MLRVPEGITLQALNDGDTSELEAEEEQDPEDDDGWDQVDCGAGVLIIEVNSRCFLNI